MATLDARVVVNVKVPAEFLDSSPRELELTVVSASGTAVKQSIQVNVQSPRLAWQTAQLEADRRTLEIGLRNTGTTQLSPYQLGGGANREAVFFGRQEIIAHIMNRDPANYLVVSGRQLGKSSLLKALERRYAEQPEVVCFYLALANEVLVPRLASVLGLPRAAGLEEIAAYVARTDRRFLFLIDEADKFVRHELNNAYHTLETLRRMSEEGHCNFILAGFWELYEQAVLDYRSPLKNFAEIIQLGALEADAYRELASKPMQTMRLEYADAALIEELLVASGQRANLMAIACHEILAQLRPDQRLITCEDVQRSLHSVRKSSRRSGAGMR